MPNFEKLHEFRLYILKYFFWQFDKDDGNYDYKKNTLTVQLPNIEKYAFVFDGFKYSGIRISNFNPTNNAYTITGIFRQRNNEG